MLFGASILKKSGSHNIVDAKVNKADKVVDIEGNKAGQYYQAGNERIIYDYPVVQEGGFRRE